MATTPMGHVSHEEADVFPILRRAGTRIRYKAGQSICAQDDPCLGVHYIEDGLIKLTTVSKRGRTAVLGFLWKGDFFGESCLAGRARHQICAEALAPSSVIFIRSRVMKRLIEQDPTVAAHFVKHLLERNRRIEEDLLDHIFHSSERRLARTLFWLAQHGTRGKTPSILEKIDQDTLAGIVGTTRPRVNYFMNKFRKMGWIQYSEGPGVTVNPSLLTFLQNDASEAR
jgi:CRP/FNR family transcriptional regulator, cyclic AMP receptor protein